MSLRKTFYFSTNDEQTIEELTLRHTASSSSQKEGEGGVPGEVGGAIIRPPSIHLTFDIDYDCRK